MKNNFRFLFFIFFACGIFSQIRAQNWVWARGAGNGSSGMVWEDGWATCMDKSGNIYETGTFYGYQITFGAVTITNTSGGHNDIYVVKYDSNGNVLWGKNAGGSDQEFGSGICCDDSNNVYVTGYFESSDFHFGSNTLVTGGGSNPFLLKFDSTGNEIWGKCGSGIGACQANSVTSDGSGNIYITGFFSQQMTFGSTILNNTSNGIPMFIVKYDFNGNVIWGKSIAATSGIGEIFGNGITTDHIGNILVTGYCLGGPPIYFDFGIDSIYDPIGDISFLAKFDSDGNEIWLRSTSINTNNLSNSVTTDPSGDIFIGGYYDGAPINFGTDTLSNSSAGNYSAFISKYDSAGNNLWAKCSNGAGVFGYTVSADDAGNCYFSGGTGYDPAIQNHSFTIGTFILIPQQDSADPMFIAKYDRNGNVVCASLLESGGDDQAGLSADHFGNVYIGGDFFHVSPFIVGSESLPLSGGETAFLAKYNCGCNPIQISNSASIQNGDSINISVSGAANYYWSPSSGLSCTNCANPFASPDSTTTYCVHVTDISGCPDSACVTVSLTGECPIYIPNAFSPNGDNQNDFMCVRSQCIKTMHFEIYNRWGEKVFESDDQNFCWDGTYRGEKCEAAVFTYSFNAVLLNGEKVLKSGNISLVK